MKSSQEPNQTPDKIGDKVVAPKPKVNTEGWRAYKPGMEINNHGKLRTVPAR